MVDVQAPIHIKRKSRYENALKTRSSKGCLISYGRGFSRWIKCTKLPSQSVKKTSRLP